MRGGVVLYISDIINQPITLLILGQLRYFCFFQKVSESFDDMTVGELYKSLRKVVRKGDSRLHRQRARRVALKHFSHKLRALYTVVLFGTVRELSSLLFHFFRHRHSEVEQSATDK